MCTINGMTFRAPPCIMSVSVSLLYLPGRQIASFLLRILLSSVVCLSLPYLSTLSPKRHGYRKKKLNTNVYFDFFYNLCLKHFSF